MANIRFIQSAAIILFSLILFCGCQEKSKETTPEKPLLIDSHSRKLELQQMLVTKYNNPEIHYELGKIYQSEGAWDKAIFEFHVAKSNAPVHWRSAAAIVKTYYQDGKKERAIVTAEKYIKQASYSAGASMDLGRAFHNELLDDEALTCYNQALKVAPNSARLNKQIGMYYREKNDLIRAEQYLRRSFDIDPTPEVARELGKLGITVDIKRKEIKKPVKKAPAEEK